MPFSRRSSTQGASFVLFLFFFLTTSTIWGSFHPAHKYSLSYTFHQQLTLSSSLPEVTTQTHPRVISPSWLVTGANRTLSRVQIPADSSHPHSGEPLRHHPSSGCAALIWLNFVTVGPSSFPLLIQLSSFHLQRLLISCTILCLLHLCLQNLLSETVTKPNQ